MIVKTGREYIVKNGFDPSKITGFFYSNTNADNQVVRESDELLYNESQSHYYITGDLGDIVYFNTSTDTFSISPTTSDGLSYTVSATINNLQGNHTLDTFGLYTESQGIKTMFSRVTFPEYTVKNSCTLNMTYYLYF